MIEVTYICDKCGKPHGPLKIRTGSAPKAPAKWRKRNGYFKCVSCVRKEKQKSEAAYFAKGPYWVCPGCFKVLSDERRYSRHVQGISQNEIQSPHNDYKPHERRPRHCKLPPAIDLIGPYKDGRVIEECLLTVRRAFTHTTFHSVFQVHPPSSWSERKERQRREADFNPYHDDWPKETSNQLREALLSTLGKEQKASA